MEFPLPTEVITFIAVLLLVVLVQAAALCGKPLSERPEPPQTINGHTIIRRAGKVIVKRKPKIITDADAYAREKDKAWAGSSGDDEPPPEAA